MENFNDESASHWFEPIATHMSSAYLRYSFTKSSLLEVERLYKLLDLRKGDRLLDVGCGPGRHSQIFFEKGIDVLGIDISEEFIRLAKKDSLGASFERQDALKMEFDAEFDAVVSLCQGAFGLLGGPTSIKPENDPDLILLEKIRKALRPQGRLAFSAFSSYFQLQYLDDNDKFDAMQGVNEEKIQVRNPDGKEMDTKIWTSCFTPRELSLMLKQVDLKLINIWSVEPGSYELLSPNIGTPEFLILAERPT